MTKRVLWSVLMLGLVGAGAATKEVPAFVAVGTVTDDAGRPVSGAVVSARCGAAGSTARTGSAKTDEAGRYRLVFEPGVYYERGLGNEAAGFQEALITVSKGGYFEKNLGRQGDLAMTDDPPATTRPEAGRYAGVVRAGTPYELNFVLAKGARVEGTLLDREGKPWAGQYVYLTGPDLPPNATVGASGKTDGEGRFKFSVVPTGYAWSFMFKDRYFGADVPAAPFTLKSPETVAFTLTADTEKHTLSAARAEPRAAAKKR
jgi:hypothetical protein